MFGILKKPFRNFLPPPEPVQHSEPELVIQRMEFNTTEILGVVSYCGRVAGFSLELPWKDNIPNISCVPSNDYYGFINDRNKLEITVPGRYNILIHSGNTFHDTKGCILVANSVGWIGQLRAILSSRDCYETLRNMIPHRKDIKVRIV